MMSGLPHLPGTMHQRIRYVGTTDHVNLAWAELGHGLPLVKVATWLTHLQHDLDSPIWARWIRFFGERFRFIRHDERGCGMSDWRVDNIALPQWVEDLESVIEGARIDRPFVLLGISQGAATAIAYAVRHPERVSHLILYGGYAVGGNKRDDATAREMYKAVTDVVRLGWGSDNPAFRQLFTSRFLPQGTQAQIDWFNQLCRRTASVENAAALLAARGNIDVREYLAHVRTPTLVLHSSHDQVVPLSQGRLLAARIPGAAFVQLDSPNHILLEHEPAWQRFREAVLEFTGQAAIAPAPGDTLAGTLTRRERTALRLLCEGRTNAQIAWQLGISEKTVRNSVSNLYRKLNVRSRAEAIVLAHRRHA